MRKSGGRKAGFRIIAVTVIVVCAVLGVSKYRLEKKYDSLRSHEKQLQEQIAAEEERALDIEEYAVYIKTKKFIKDLANSVMGLTDPDAVIIRGDD